MATAPVPKMARTHFKAWSGDPAPIRSLPSATPPPAHSMCGRGLPGGGVGVASLEALSLDTQKARATQAQSDSKVVLPAPSPWPRPILPGGVGRASSARWLESQGLPCCESRPGSVLARSPAVLTRTARASLGSNHNHAQPQQHLLSRSAP